MKPKINEPEQPLKKKLWAAADKLRKNVDAAEYKHVVLGLICTNCNVVIDIDGSSYDDEQAYGNCNGSEEGIIVLRKCRRKGRAGGNTGTGCCRDDREVGSRAADVFRKAKLEDSANLPDPDILAREIAENLDAALQQFATITEDLGKGA
jgi:type I restriction-modification system DNA methylase subunit